MLREIHRTRQIPDEARRRWFTSGDLDLIVWYDDTDAISGFQLCYDKGRNERALTWKRPDSYLHERVADGENRPGKHKATPILAADGAFPLNAVVQLFQSQAGRLPPEITDTVTSSLLAYQA